jgi:hypothetical protein
MESVLAISEDGNCVYPECIQPRKIFAFFRAGLAKNGIYYHDLEHVSVALVYIGLEKNIGEETDGGGLRWPSPHQ